MNEQTKTLGLAVYSEPLDDIPLLINIIKEMGIGELIDGCVKADLHWEGASIGTVISIWLCYLLSTQDHRLVAVREWVMEHRELFKRELGIELRPTDCSDDRLAIILSRLGQVGNQRRLDKALLEHWWTIYALPTETIRLDGTVVSVYHEREDDADTLLKFGFNPAPREGMRQFKVMMATLDPLGMPLTAQTVSGEHGDDLLYIPSYEQAVDLLGSRDVLVVGDSKMSSLAIRGQLIQRGSRYLCPLNENTLPGKERLGHLTDILAHPDSWQSVYRQDQQGRQTELIAVVVERERSQRWAPKGGEPVYWKERLIFVRSVQLRASQLHRLERRWQRLQTQLEKLRQPPGPGRKSACTDEGLRKKVQTLLKQTGLTHLVEVNLIHRILLHGQSRWIVDSYARDEVRWQAYCDRLGWRVYATNTTPTELEATASVGVYRHQVLHERTFSRLKTRRFNIQPVFLRDEQRIVGLTWLLVLALRILTLTEFRLRQALKQADADLIGLNPAAPSQTTQQPTVDRLLAFFHPIYLTVIDIDGQTRRYVTQLSPTQRQILALLSLPEDLYARLALPPP